MNFQIKEVEGFKYIETGGEGTPLMLLHGLFGALSNFQDLIEITQAEAFAPIYVRLAYTPN